MLRSLNALVACGARTIALGAGALGAGAPTAAAASSAFADPGGIATDGTHVWVTNNTGHSVTELSATTGALVQVIS
jgi:hypothetical protein